MDSEEVLKESVEVPVRHKVGMVGCGKLGLPVILSIENHGHEVYGYDINPAVYDYVANRQIPYEEAGTPELLRETELKMLGSIEEIVRECDIVFCPVQTPHHPMYEGITRIPEERKDFDYSFLKAAVAEIADCAQRLDKDVTLVVISTVLPGTTARDIKPLLNPHVKFAYNPFFIAMGTTRQDFEHPEFVLLGMDESPEAIETVKKFYSTIHDRPVFQTNVVNAELIKVAYNTFISGKISMINTLQMLCEEIGADIDAVSDAFGLATERLISPKYLRGGMPDGGGCHPRDNIALSWLSKEKGLPYDWFEGIMKQREATTEWFADRLIKTSEGTGLPIVIMGKAFKRGTNLTVGSPSILLSNILQEKGVDHVMYDPHVDPGSIPPAEPAVYFVGCNHPEFENWQYPQGSVVVDVWGITKDQYGVEVKRIGRH